MTMNNWKSLAWPICVAASIVAAHTALALKTDKTEPAAKAVADAAKDDSTMHNAAQVGTPLLVASNVSDEASIQAVLIPTRIAKKIFGKEIAENYAAVEVIVSNRDPKASLVIHSVFLDYSKWLLGKSAMQASTNSDPNQAETNPSQVASMESRLVRGELLDAQPSTLRNITMRTLTFLGTAGVAFEFPFSADVIKGIGAFNGTVVPGAATLWPDGTVNQLNRISDFGFQTNKIIPKQGSDILVAFFPLQRFLTDGFRGVFLTDPAAWFVPYELLADPKTEPTFEKFVRPVATAAERSSGQSNPCEMGKAGADCFRTEMLQTMFTKCDPPDGPHQEGAKLATESTCELQQVMDGVSLNKIRVVIQGVMTVDVATVPATVYSVDFDGGNVPGIWTKTKVAQTGTITGVYLTGGNPTVVGDNGKAINGIDIKAVAEGSSDTELNFTMTLTDCIAPGTKVNFVVTKNSAGDSTAAGSNTKTTTTAKKPASPPVPSTLYEFPQQPSDPCPAAAEKPKTTDPTAAETPAKPASEKTEPKAGEKAIKEPKS
jgi:hypothetical protein